MLIFFFSCWLLTKIFHIIHWINVGHRTSKIPFHRISFDLVKNLWSKWRLILLMLFVTVDTPDPYLILRIKTAPEGRRRTKTKDNEVNPVWNEEFTFFLDGAVDNKLRMFTNPRQMVSYHLFSSRCKELQSILFAWSFWFEGRGGRELSPDSILSICLSTIHQVRANRRKKLCRFAK